MPLPPQIKGRPVSMAGLRMILLTMAGFQLCWTACVLLLKGRLFEVDPGLSKPLLPAIGLLAAAEGLTYLFLRFRLKKAWMEELARSPYQSNADVPVSFVQIVLIGAALTEGLGLFAALIYLVSGEPLAILLAGAAFFLILALWPREETLFFPRGTP